MAYLRKINGRYYAYFTDKTRKPKQKSVALGTSLKSAAVLKLHDLERRFADPDDPYDPWAPVDLPQSLTINEATKAFLASRSHLRPATQETYAEVLKGFKKGLAPNLMLESLAPEHLRQFIHNPLISRATQRKRYTHLRVFFRWTVKERLLRNNPLEKVRQPRPQKKAVVFLTNNDLQRLLTAIDVHEELQKSKRGNPDIAWLRDIIRIGVCTGMRRGELLNLRWSDVDLHHRFIVVRNSKTFRTKSGHERRVPLAGDALDVLQRLHKEQGGEHDGLVLVDNRGLPIKPDRVSKRFKAMISLAKLDERLHFHSLRHTCGSWLAMKGVPLRIIQAILGHASITTTEIYAHLSPDTMQAAMQQAFGNGEPLDAQ